MKNKKDLAYEYFNRGEKDSRKIADEIGSTLSTVATYKGDWKKELLATLSTEEAASYFAGEKELWQIKNDKTAETEAETPVKEKEESKQQKVKLKKIVKVVEIQGEIATYQPVMENSYDIFISEQVITLSRQEMKDFAEELLAVAEDEEENANEKEN